MKQGIIISVMFACVALNARAQHKGIVLDPDSVPAEYATVALLNPSDSSYIAGDVTNERGEFSVASPVKKVIVRVNHAGYPAVYKDAESEDVGVIRLAAAEIDEVVVQGNGGSLITRKVDRLVYNVAADPFAGEKTALEVLEQTPRMVVSRTDGNIEMVGRSGVRVLVNGRLLAEDEGKSFLQSLKGADIETIEVIPVPPAKYHAQGDIGMVNIRLRTDPGDGVQGSVTANYSQGDRASTMPSATINLHKGIWSLRAGVVPRIMNGRQESGEEFIYSDRSFERTGDALAKLRDYSGNVMLQVNPSEKVEIGAIIEGGFENNKMYETKRSGYSDMLETTTTDARSNPTARRFNGSLYGDIALGDKGSKLTITYNNHFRRRGIDDRFLTNEGGEENDLLSSGTYYYRTNSLMADVSVPVKTVSIEAGASGQMVDNTCYLGLTGDNLTGLTADNTRYRYDENIYAAYVSAAAPLGKKIYAKAGLRYEHTNLGGRTRGVAERMSQNYDNLFPTAYVSYNINDNHSLNVDYARRIDRPYFEDLNPFVRYYDINLYHAGNPDLRPSASDELEINYSYKGNLNVTLWGNLLHDKIDYIPLFNDDGTESQEALNCVDTRKAGITLSYNYMPVWRVMIFAQASAYINHSSCRLPELNINDSNGWGGNINLYANLFLNKTGTLIGGVSFFQKLPSTDGLVRESGQAALGINLSYSLLKGRLNLMLGAEDIFRQNTSKSRRYYSDYKYTSFTDSRQRAVWAGITWNFGKRSVNDVNVNNRDVIGSRGL